MTSSASSVDRNAVSFLGEGLRVSVRQQSMHCVCGFLLYVPSLLCLNGMKCVEQSGHFAVFGVATLARMCVGLLAISRLNDEIVEI